MLKNLQFERKKWIWQNPLKINFGVPCHHLIWDMFPPWHLWWLIINWMAQTMEMKGHKTTINGFQVRSSHGTCIGTFIYASEGNLFLRVYPQLFIKTGLKLGSKWEKCFSMKFVLSNLPFTNYLKLKFPKFIINKLQV